MNGLEVALCAACWPVAAKLLSVDQHFKRAMHCYEENIVAFKEIAQHLEPPVGIQNMLKNQIVTSVRICGQGSVEAIKKGLSRVCPGEFAASEAVHRKNARIAKMIYRDMPERLFDTGLKCFGNSGFSTA